MVSGDYRLLPDCLPIVFRGEGRHAAIATFRREVHLSCATPRRWRQRLLRKRDQVLWRRKSYLQIQAWMSWRLGRENYSVPAASDQLLRDLRRAQGLGVRHWSCLIR